jgi:hypothetical protein
MRGISGNNMVLQRNKPIAIQVWAGNGEPGKSYTFTVGIIEATFGSGIFFFCHSNKKWHTKMVFNLKPGEVHYFEISVPSASANTRFVNADDFKIWDKAFELKYLEKYKK